MTEKRPYPPWIEDILREQNKPVTCNTCGKIGPNNGWTCSGKPICATCLSHDLHKRFEPRCALCWMDRQNAKGEAIRIRAFQEGISERTEDAPGTK